MGCAANACVGALWQHIERIPEAGLTADVTSGGVTEDPSRLLRRTHINGTSTGWESNHEVLTADRPGAPDLTHIPGMYDHRRMRQRRRFDENTLSAIAASKILGIRAGMNEHRVIGIWVVVVERRVFVRSWTLKPGGWYRTFLVEPRGILRIADRDIPIRAIQTRSERLKAAVDRAYAEKYNTPGSLKYVRGFKRPTRRNTTTELVPL